MGNDLMDQVQQARTDAALAAVTGPHDKTETTTFNVEPGARNAAGEELLAVRLVVTRYAPDGFGRTHAAEVKAEELTRAARGRVPAWHPLPPAVARALAFDALGV